MKRIVSFFCFAILVSGFALPARAGLTFTTTFDPTVDASAQAVINSVLAGYSALLSDNVNVSLKFKNTGAGLGTSLTYSFGVDYQTYYNALVADATSAADATALAGIAPGGANNPVNGTSTIFQGRPGLAAIGINIDTSGISGYLDGEIDLNLALMNYDRVSIDPNKYDLQAVTQHEVNEVLGIISNVSQSNPRPIDLFRYTSGGSRTFTTAGDDAYFSLDSTTLLARFNQNSNGDYGDFWSYYGGNTPQVQDAFSTPGATPNMNVEITMLDVVGWNVSSTNAVPEPATIVMLGMSGGVLLLYRHRLRKGKPTVS